MPREEVLEIKKAPPTYLIAEETAEEAGELSEKLERALKSFGEILIPSKVSQITKSVMHIASAGVTLYIMAVATATMLPYAVQGFAVMGQILGYVLPLMMMMSMLSLIFGLFKRLIGW